MLGSIQNKIRESFNKVAKKEELAAKVLTHEILVKFKALKENLLKSVILSFNLAGLDSSDSLPSFVKDILTSKSLDSFLKSKLLLPAGDFKNKLTFTQYYKSLNEQVSSHTLIMEYLTQFILGDDKTISYNW